MQRKTKVAVLITSLVLVGLALPLIRQYFGRFRSGQNAEYQLNSERTRLLSPERVVKLINPSPGSSVLDIGAGYGLFTFPLAKALGESGTVFATDTDPLVVDYLKEH